MAAFAARLPEQVRTVGVISGTSMDAVDVAALTTDGREVVQRGAALAVPYTKGERAQIRAAMADAAGVTDSEARTPAMATAERVVTEAHGTAIARFLAGQAVAPALIGWHGQTVFHAPERGVTVQLGKGDALAARLGLPVVSRLRHDDVAAGGQGAPLVPVYHRALVRAKRLEEPCVIINLGGVANLTYIAGDTMIAFDTGPASAMIDDQMAQTGEPYDAGGALAATGRVDDDALARLLDHPYFASAAPKSLDRDAFDAAPVAHLPLADKIATLTRFSAAALRLAFEKLPQRPRTVLAAGGGVHNATLMADIESAVAMPVQSASGADLSADFLEAEAFAYLAVRAVRALPITFPLTTGAPRPLTGGRLHLPR